jgi:hypothetical protein
VRVSERKDWGSGDAIACMLSVTYLCCGQIREASMGGGGERYAGRALVQGAPHPTTRIFHSLSYSLSPSQPLTLRPSVRPSVRLHIYLH